MERAVFMLREVFVYGYPDVARITGKVEVNCPDLRPRPASNPAGGQARDNVPAPARQAEGEELARHFFEAAAGGMNGAARHARARRGAARGRRRQDAGDREAAGRAAARHADIVSLLRRARDMGVSLRLAWVNGRPGPCCTTSKGAWSA